MTTRKKVLLAEDNPADVELTKLALSELELDIELVHFFDGKELLDYVSQNELDNIALILLDLNMPRKGGIEVLYNFSLHEEHKKLPVVVFSSSIREEDVKACYGYGANAYVAKPIDIHNFTKTIGSIARFWAEVNVLPSYADSI